MTALLPSSTQPTSVSIVPVAKTAPVHAPTRLSDLSPSEAQVPALLSHQRPIGMSEKRFKCGCCGRRWGKTRFALKACVTGHGPVIDRNGRKGYLHKGMVDGTEDNPLHFVWCALDFGQAQEIWEKELKPRFRGKLGVRISEKTRSIFIGYSQLQLISSENIDVVRGYKLDGFVGDEAAHWNLEYGWRRVIRPALTDKKGWSIFISTTEVGSFFNRLCDEIENGVRTAEWGLFEGATNDNPKIDAEEFESLKAEYPPGSADALQELYAKRLESLGTLFQSKFFHYYPHADQFSVTLPIGDGQYRLPFQDIIITADLAISQKETADYCAFLVAGLGAPNPKGWRTAAILDGVIERMEAPDQITRLAELCDHWRPTKVLIEAVAYQLAAVQNLQRARPNVNILPSYPDTDKRSRAVPFATAMSRADVWWPRQSGWLDVAVKQLLKFPNGPKGSIHPEDHMDFVDACSILALELNIDTSGGGSTGRWGTTVVRHG